MSKAGRAIASLNVNNLLYSPGAVCLAVGLCFKLALDPSLLIILDYVLSNLIVEIVSCDIEWVVDEDTTFAYLVRMGGYLKVVLVLSIWRIYS